MACRHDALLPLKYFSLFGVPRGHEILIHNHNTMIQFRKLTLKHHYYLIYIPYSDFSGPTNVPYSKRNKFLVQDPRQNHMMHLVVIPHWSSLEQFIGLFFFFSSCLWQFWRVQVRYLQNKVSLMSSHNSNYTFLARIPKKTCAFGWGGTWYLFIPLLV